MTMYDYVWLYMTMYDYVWLCKTMYDYVWLCMTVYDYVQGVLEWLQKSTSLLLRIRSNI